MPLRKPRYGGADSSAADPGTLFLVPTPLGNLEDITLRALRVLRCVDWVAAEDTRRARVLFEAHGIRNTLISHHAHNEHREAPRLVARLMRGESGALITDAGMPGISDPGFLLAREARAGGVRVDVLPGPSAVTTALVASGFPPEPFCFVGYVPNTAGRRHAFLEQVRTESRTLVCFETPHRVRRTLSLAGEVLPDRQLALVREMTKLHEEVLRGSPADVSASLADPVRGEIVLVWAPLGRKRPEASTGSGSADPGTGGGKSPACAEGAERREG